MALRPISLATEKKQAQDKETPSSAHLQAKLAATLYFSHSTPKDLVDAAQLFKILAKNLKGKPREDALYNAAVSFLKNKNHAEAMTCLTPLAENNDLEAQLVLGLLCLKSKQFTKGLKYLEPVAKAGNPFANYYMGLACERGDGSLTPNVHQALRHYRQSTLEAAIDRFEILDEARIRKICKTEMEVNLQRLQSDLKQSLEIKTLFEAQNTALNTALEEIDGYLNAHHTALSSIDTEVRKLLENSKAAIEKQKRETAFAQAETYFAGPNKLQLNKFYMALFNKSQSLLTGHIVLASDFVKGKVPPVTRLIKGLFNNIPIFGFSALGFIPAAIATSKLEGKGKNILALKLALSSVGILSKSIAHCLTLRYEQQLLRTTSMGAKTLATCAFSRIEAYINTVDFASHSQKATQSKDSIEALTQLITLGILKINKGQGLLGHLRNKKIALAKPYKKSLSGRTEDGIFRRPGLRTSKGIYSATLYKKRIGFSLMSWLEYDKALFSRLEKYGTIAVSESNIEALSKVLEEVYSSKVFGFKLEPLDSKHEKYKKWEKHYAADELGYFFTKDKPSVPLPMASSGSAPVTTKLAEGLSSSSSTSLSSVGGKVISGMFPQANIPDYPEYPFKLRLNLFEKDLAPKKMPELAALYKENGALKEKLKAHQTNQQKLEDFYRERENKAFEALEKEKKPLMDKIKSLQSLLKENENKRFDLSVNLKVSERFLERTKGEYKEAKEDIKKLEAELRAFNKRFYELMNRKDLSEVKLGEVNRRLGEVLSSKSSLSEENSALKKLQEELRNGIQQLEVMRKELHGRIGTTDVALQQMTGQRDRLQGRIVVLEGESGDLQSRFSALEVEKNRLNNENVDLRSTLEERRLALVAMTSRATAAESARATQAALAASLRTQVGSLTKRNAALLHQFESEKSALAASRKREITPVQKGKCIIHDRLLAVKNAKRAKKGWSPLSTLG